MEFCTDIVDGREISQVVVPKGLREKVLMMAHDAVMSGHQGQKKTTDRIWKEFWWPVFSADVMIVKEQLLKEELVKYL